MQLKIKNLPVFRFSIPDFCYTVYIIFLGSISSRKLFYSRDSVILGEYDTRHQMDCIHYYGHRDCSEKPIKRNIQEVILHPNWKWSYFDNDVALIRMSSPVEYSGEICY